MFGRKKSRRKVETPWYQWSVAVALIYGLFLLLGNFISTTLPILSADVGDYYISIEPVPIEAKPSHPEILPDNMDSWNNISIEPESPQAIISI